MRISQDRPCFAMTLVEMMVSLGCGVLIIAAVLTAGIALQRSFAAVEGYSIAEGDQLRVLDYIAMDCRRAIKGTITTAAGTTLVTPAVDKGSWISVSGTYTWTSDTTKPNTLLLSVPNYYDGNGNPVAPDSTIYANTGAIQYGSSTPTTICYYQSGSNFMRQVGTDPTNTTNTKAIATNVASFVVTPLNQSSTNGTVSYSITFSPRFTYLPGPGPIAGTTVYSNTFLRNASARQ